MTRETWLAELGKFRSIGGLEPAVVARSVSRIAYGIQPVGPEALADQQRIADTFHALKLIPRPVKVADSAWQPTTQQAAR